MDVVNVKNQTMTQKSFISEETKPTCEDCKHFLIWEDGNGITEPRYTEIDCNHPKAEEVAKDFLYDDDHMGEKDVSQCKGFDPKIVKNCARHKCKKPMNIPEYQAKYHDTVYDKQVYCSEECRKIAWNEFCEDMGVPEEYR